MHVSTRQMVSPGSPDPYLSIAIVLYCPDQQLLKATLATLSEALVVAGIREESSLTLIDHSPATSRISEDHLRSLWPGEMITVIDDEANPGFGAGHNRLLPSAGRYHLVLNPDTELDPESIREALAFMEANASCGLLAPAVFGEDGERLFLCRRYPTIFDLLLRGFAPHSIQGFFRERLHRYELRDVIGDTVAWDPPIVSGCFMFLRGECFRALEGFDERFFLYFEDYDLSIRAGSIARLAYVPSVRIVHHGGGAARKGFRHVGLFARSASRFFSKHGWKWI